MSSYGKHVRLISGLGHVGCAVAFWIDWAFPAQRNMRKVGPAGCWLAHKDGFLRKDGHTPITNGGSAERSQTINIGFQVAMKTQVVIR